MEKNTDIFLDGIENENSSNYSDISSYIENEENVEEQKSSDTLEKELKEKTENNEEENMENNEEENMENNEEENMENENEEDMENNEEENIENDEEDSELDQELESLFDDLDEAKESVDKIEEDIKDDYEVSQLKQTLNDMEGKLKKLLKEKADLTYRLAEVEAFGSDNIDPKILLLNRNLVKANEDDKAKTKAISILKDLLYDLTGEDYDQNKINKDIDMLSAIESYNSTVNPNLKSGKKEEDDGLSI